MTSEARTDLFRRQRAGMLAALAAECGASVEAFGTDALSVVPLLGATDGRPKVALLATAGTGTILSVDTRYIEWVRANVPERHPYAYFPAFLSGLVAEGARRGETLKAAPANLCFAFAGRGGEIPAVPDGYRLERHGKAWTDELRRSYVFHNGLGSRDDPDADTTQLYAFAVHDAEGPVAIAGVFRSIGGMHEIGVDVLRRARGMGLAEVVVDSAARAIVESGETVFYTCSPTNIRSQRTAMASGFLPVASMAVVFPVPAPSSGED